MLLHLAANTKCCLQFFLNRKKVINILYFMELRKNIFKVSAGKKFEINKIEIHKIVIVLFKF